MGIPIFRPVAAEAPGAGDGRSTYRHPTAIAASVPHDDATADPVPGPCPADLDTFAHDDDEVVLLLPTYTRLVPGRGAPPSRAVRSPSGSGWCAATASLSPRRRRPARRPGREVDTTKTATDGGGELRAPHGGRFLMIVSADGYQPRAATLTVDEQPVELALLLPRSAAVAGSVRSGGEAVRDARVVVRQDHDVVDEALTAGDGRYRFDDLAEGFYIVSATGDRVGRDAAAPRRGCGRARRRPRRASRRTLIA